MIKEKKTKTKAPAKTVIHKAAAKEVEKKKATVTKAKVLRAPRKAIVSKKITKASVIEKHEEKPLSEVKEEAVVLIKEVPVPKEVAVELPIELPPVASKLVEQKVIELKFPITVKDLAIKLQEKSSYIIKLFMDMRIMAGINQFLDEQVVSALCVKLGVTVKKALSDEEELLKEHKDVDDQALLKPRAPVVTFMGHVDHGKTSLLDAIRKAKVAEQEHGGITQHIGAYRVSLDHGEITFLDTPGHEAFTAMRARGASVTDIVVLVVAADDGLMPQTREAIDHARAAGVSLIVAMNKIDKPQANIDKVKKQLADLDLKTEDWGGKTIAVPVSAKTGEGIDNLLEMIILEAQMLELKANPARLARGIVLESKMSKGKGPVATLLVQNGTLRLNETIVLDTYYAKIRAMFDDHGQAMTEVGPSVPVEILGLSGIPSAGEQFFVIEDEKKARELIEKRQEHARQEKIHSVKKISLEELYSQIKEGKIKELKLVIKADVQGSLEAIRNTLEKIEATEIKLNIIHEGAGAINSSDVILAAASNALVLGFNVEADEPAKDLIGREGVEVRTYNIIYELANDIKTAIEGMLEPKLKKIFLGRIEVRKVFKLSRSGIIAGSYVTKGKIMRSSSVSVLRNGQPVFEGKISSLKRFKDDVREVGEGYECGISIGGFDQLQEGDIIEAFETQKIIRKLE